MKSFIYAHNWYLWCHIRLNPLDSSCALVGKVEKVVISEFILTHTISSQKFLLLFLLQQAPPNSEPQFPPPQNGANLPNKWCRCTVPVSVCGEHSAQGSVQSICCYYSVTGTCRACCVVWLLLPSGAQLLVRGASSAFKLLGCRWSIAPRSYLLFRGTLIFSICFRLIQSFLSGQAECWCLPYP